MLGTRILGGAGLLAMGAGWLVSVPVGIAALAAAIGAAYFSRKTLKAPIALDPTKKIPFELVEKEVGPEFPIFLALFSLSVSLYVSQRTSATIPGVSGLLCSHPSMFSVFLLEST